ncbi:MAG: DNA ligase [Colwellia sp.]|nr:DNA ligase [Colwellia sp.]MCW8865841.1 DNA ligase [Colwellia sp.]MCW9082121.1 DNA ligase [Colwellia sp.]
MKSLSLLLLSCLLLPLKLLALTDSYQKPAIQKAVKYRPVDDISQYWLSEKLDGIRGYWNGKQLLTRQGKLIHSPKWFTRNWPDTVMDGELWIARNHFQQTLSCVSKINIDEACWRKVRFMIFDLPEHGDTFTQRINAMQQLTSKTNSNYLTMIKQFKINDIEQLDLKLNSIIASKGEGLMLHRGSALYHIGRSSSIMKLKKHQDAEAVVIAYIAGKGKYTGKVGALKVKMLNGTIFNIGSGLPDYERANPPAIGSTISFKYNGKTQAGIPRFARYWRIRAPNTSRVDK